MGLLSKLEQFTKVGLRYIATVNSGGGYSSSCDHFTTPGDDSQPLPGDAVNIEATQRTGMAVATGYINPKCLNKTQPGGKRIYARDPETGEEIVEFWLQNDGSALMANEKGEFLLTPAGDIKGSNDNGNFSLEANGNFLVNGVTIDTDGNITSPAKVSAPEVAAATSLKVSNQEVKGHTHISTAPGDPTGPWPPA